MRPSDLREAVEDRTRREIMLACWEEPGTSTDIRKRLNASSDGHITPKLQELHTLGALVHVERPGARGQAYGLNPACLDLLLDAERRTSLGTVKPRFRLIVIPRAGVARTWELLTSGPLREDIAWLLEVAGPSASPSLVLAVDERVEQGRGGRVVLQLDAEQVPAESLEIREAVSLEELVARAEYYGIPTTRALPQSNGN